MKILFKVLAVIFAVVVFVIIAIFIAQYFNTHGADKTYEMKEDGLTVLSFNYPSKYRVISHDFGENFPNATLFDDTCWTEGTLMNIILGKNNIYYTTTPEAFIERTGVEPEYKEVKVGNSTMFLFQLIYRNRMSIGASNVPEHEPDMTGPHYLVKFVPDSIVFIDLPQTNCAANKASETETNKILDSIVLEGKYK